MPARRAASMPETAGWNGCKHNSWRPRALIQKGFFSPRRDAYYAGRHAKRVPDLGFLKIMLLNQWVEELLPEMSTSLPTKTVDKPGVAPAPNPL
ncbi:hypothetical protein [Burkholderia glumae]|uniref:hypothetical protein n=1 Tax=Burkholderia glumae TaxID=337 RepID=UPI002151CFEC|nr:hypothetical protein [Burkholderia glumae]